MNEEEAIKILIATAVCIDSKLRCDDDCPFYNKNGDCKYIEHEFELEQAVKTLNNKRLNK